ncbi:nitrogen fixation protein NifX [Synechococcus sp. 65AY6A5]|jgi:nitrogen fixation protein NifX|uniref:nitrogen fixation protein NifX n=1 Tax=Synechococcus sp. 65AY6A5 TaxID=1353265 RepID=UPI000C17D063|nr:nitrogen fixation protein NifX [Synechococcus sp. 65AY6A5]PIK88017.1 nitrogen fixation protein NifX [Synechococcus sp. 65AY6A5]
MQVAFTTRDGKHVNAHFGWANQIDLYEVTPEGYRFCKTLTFGGNLEADGNEDKLVPKLQALADVTLIYVAAIGSSAAARLINRRITPIKVQSEEEPIESLLQRLVSTLHNPPPWLRKVLLAERARKAEAPNPSTSPAEV